MATISSSLANYRMEQMIKMSRRYGYARPFVSTIGSEGCEDRSTSESSVTSRSMAGERIRVATLARYGVHSVMADTDR